uniref:Transcription factor 15 n=1 Tax=Cacopsylla melanoneura TaxID=428564 RepID=A0A8D8VPN1_9HEMI
MKNVFQDDSDRDPVRTKHNGKHGKAFAKDFLKQRDQANARERIRTHSVNVAFSSLRNLLPSIAPDRKLSKIEILRMARNYISHLTSHVNHLSEKLDYETGVPFSGTDCNHSTCSQCDHCASPITPTSPSSINSSIPLDDYNNDTLDNTLDHTGNTMDHTGNTMDHIVHSISEENQHEMDPTYLPSDQRYQQTKEQNQICNQTYRTKETNELYNQNKDINQTYLSFKTGKQPYHQCNEQSQSQAVDCMKNQTNNQFITINNPIDNLHLINTDRNNYENTIDNLGNQSLQDSEHFIEESIASEEDQYEQQDRNESSCREVNSNRKPIVDKQFITEVVVESGNNYREEHAKIESVHQEFSENIIEHFDSHYETEKQNIGDGIMDTQEL